MTTTLAAAAGARPGAVPEAALPGGVSVLLRAIFDLPGWAVAVTALAGFTLAALVALAAWRRRVGIQEWLRLRWRGTGWRLAFGLAGLVVVGGAGAIGEASWNFMQHDNAFCVSCHVMRPAWQRFGTSEHRALTCHTCHRQSMYANVRQLVLWFRDRPAEVAPHRKVPSERCAECHARYATSAGHKVHLESKDTALRNVECTSCHSIRTHEFAADERTCLQSGCHATIRVRVSVMSPERERCASCHRFDRAAAAAVVSHPARSGGANGHGRPGSPDRLPSRITTSALSPTGDECLSCHRMEARVGSFPADEPHGGRCGACHDPHQQSSARAAASSCGRASCHGSTIRESPVHRAVPADDTLACVRCHRAHQFRVDARDCTGCHGTSLDKVRITETARSRLRAGLDTLARQFSHARHRGVNCAECHSGAGGHGSLSLRSGKDCSDCHHRAGGEARACRNCHATRLASLPARQVAVTFRLPRGRTAQRTVAFEHRDHAQAACVTCHAGGGAAARSGCAGCHDSHHSGDTRCSGCHADAPTLAHNLASHGSCSGSGCHAEQVFRELPLGREACLVCHRVKAAHFSGRECVTCHMTGARQQAVRRSVAGRK